MITRDRPQRLLGKRLLPLMALGPATVVSMMLFVGCGRGDGPALRRVSGAVSYGGMPVTAGSVTFTPDGARHNTGRQGVAPIKDGHFDTRGSRAPGIEGGPMIVQVTGLLDATAKRQFQHKFATELARDGDVILDIDIDPRVAPEVKPIDF